MALQTNSLSGGNLYVDGTSLLGRVEELKLPEVAYLMTEHKALGTLGTPEFFNMNIDKMAGSIKWNSFYPDALKALANPSKGVKLMFRSSSQNFQGGDLTDEVPYVVHMTVQVKKWPLGEFKKADPVELTTDFACSAIKLMYDGETLMEVDVHNQILFVNGVDLLAQYRQNTGI